MVDLILAFMKKFSNFAVHKSTMTLVNNAINLLKNHLDEYTKEGQTVPKEIEYIADNLVIHSLIWGVAAVVDDSSRREISMFIF